MGQKYPYCISTLERSDGGCGFTSRPGRVLMVLRDDRGEERTWQHEQPLGSPSPSWQRSTSRPPGPAGGSPDHQPRHGHLRPGHQAVRRVGPRQAATPGGGPRPGPGSGRLAGPAAPAAVGRRPGVAGCSQLHRRTGADRRAATPTPLSSQGILREVGPSLAYIRSQVQAIYHQFQLVHQAGAGPGAAVCAWSVPPQ